MRRLVSSSSAPRVNNLAKPVRRISISSTCHQLVRDVANQSIILPAILLISVAFVSETKRRRKIVLLVERRSSSHPPGPRQVSFHALASLLVLTFRRLLRIFANVTHLLRSRHFSHVRLRLKVISITRYCSVSLGIARNRSTRD